MQYHQLKVRILPFWILAKPKADLTDASSVESSPLFLWISTLSTPLEELAKAHGSPACMAVMFRTYSVRVVDERHYTEQCAATDTECCF